MYLPLVYLDKFYWLRYGPITNFAFATISPFLYAPLSRCFESHFCFKVVSIHHILVLTRLHDPTALPLSAAHSTNSKAVQFTNSSLSCATHPLHQSVAAHFTNSTAALPSTLPLVPPTPLLLAPPTQSLLIPPNLPLLTTENQFYCVGIKPAAPYTIT